MQIQIVVLTNIVQNIALRYFIDNKKTLLFICNCYIFIWGFAYFNKQFYCVFFFIHTCEALYVLYRPIISPLWS